MVSVSQLPAVKKDIVFGASQTNIRSIGDRFVDFFLTFYFCLDYEYSIIQTFPENWVIPVETKVEGG